MKFTIISFVTLITVALAFTPEENNGQSPRSGLQQGSQEIDANFPSDVVKRQSDNAGEIPANVAVMTDADGNVVTFDPSSVHLDSLAKGL
jgi:hypothetical protein